MSCASGGCPPGGAGTSYPPVSLLCDSVEVQRNTCCAIPHACLLSPRVTSYHSSTSSSPTAAVSITAAGVYSALFQEGRALSKEESAVADAELGLNGLTDSDEESGIGTGNGTGSGSVGGLEGDEAAASRELQKNPLLALQASPSGRFLSEAGSEKLLSNAASMQLFFLWSGTAPNGIKHSTSCAVRTSKSVWLFECGEDSQRHLVRCALGGWVGGGLGGLGSGTDWGRLAVLGVQAPKSAAAAPTPARGTSNPLSLP